MQMWKNQINPGMSSIKAEFLKASTPFKLMKTYDLRASDIGVPAQYSSQKL